MPKRVLGANARAIQQQRDRAERERHDAACKTWKAMSRELQMRAVREVVLTRGGELKRAYPDVLAVSFGYRSKENRPAAPARPPAADGAAPKQSKRPTRAKRRRKFSVVLEPCVGFLVEKKWKKSRTARRTAAQRARALPEFLYAYCDTGKSHALCAVPTDVEARANYRLHVGNNRNAEVRVSDGTQELTGTLCCVVRLPNNDGKLYAVGCHHVFAMSKSCPDVPPKVDLFVNPTSGPSQSLGTLSLFCGMMETFPPNFAFDAALAEVTGKDALLARAVKVPDTTKVIPQDATPATYEILTSRGLVEAELVKVLPEFDGIDEYLRAKPLFHLNLYKLHVTGPTLDDRTFGGDSGSPVFSAEDGAFAGMHIAGSDDGEFTLMIPAYDLLRASNYGVTNNPSAMMKIVTPDKFK